MRESDFPPFAAMLDDVAGLKREVYTPGQKAMFFRALAEYPLEQVRAGLDAHVKHPKRGQFLPMPADVIAQILEIVADDGRPGAEEAWAIAMRSTDEADTVVWTTEMAEALGIARPVMLAGDEVGARMAFKEAYTRLIEAARRAGRAPAWSPSLGRDPQLRVKALDAAVSRGLLPASSAVQLPAPRGRVALLSSSREESIPEAARAGLLALRDWLTRPKDEISEDAAAKLETEDRQRATAARVDEYAGRLQ